MKDKIKIILDGDPGHDDAIGWVIANVSEELEILALTAVNGNCPVEKAGYNAQRIAALIGLDVPIALGKDAPFTNDRFNAPSVHGKSGLDGPILPEPVRALETISAVELMAKILKEETEPVTIVSTGPLTNTATLLRCYPELKSKIRQISLMGGGIAFGNWSPAAEFNILVDPEAAEIVFNSGVPIIMAGLDVTEKALILGEDVERIKQLNNPVSDIVWKWLEFFYKFHQSIGYPGAPMHDPCAVIALIHPEFFDIRDYYVQIETQGEYCRGATIGDVYNVTGRKPNAKCLMNVDRKAFVDFIIESIGKYGKGE